MCSVFFCLEDTAMKYKEQEIGVPTLEMVKEYINKKKFVISPRKVYQKYVDNGWTTTKHQPILTLEAAINGCNSYPEKYSDIDGPECYKELLTDVRWIEFSRKVKLFYGNQCQGCGAKTKNLQAHHKVYYTKKKVICRKPWEYDMSDMTALCKNCHEKVHHIRIENKV